LIVFWIVLAAMLLFVVIKVAREPNPLKAVLEFVLVSCGIGIIVFCAGVISLMRAVSHTNPIP
jgi:hypothetical protein